MNTRYNLLEYFQNRWDQLGRKCAFNAENIDQFNKWKEATRNKLKEITGYDTMKTCDLNHTLLGQKDCGKYIRYHLEIQTWQNLTLT